MERQRVVMDWLRQPDSKLPFQLNDVCPNEGFSPLGVRGGASAGARAQGYLGQRGMAWCGAWRGGGEI